LVCIFYHRGRSNRSQSKHDKKVESLAKNLERQGFDVKADIKGFKQPDTIGGVRPDVVGTRPGEQWVYEVETKDSVDSARDQKQKAEFKKQADRSKKTTFKRFTAD